MKGKLWLLLVGCLCFMAGHSQSYNFRHLDITDGISQVCIPSIYQDEVGALWFGTTEGLNRYNGHGMRSFRPLQGGEGLTHNEINSLCGDKNGRMYIRSSGDLIRFDIATEKFTCLRRDDVSAIFCRDSILWVGCRDAVYTYNPQEGQLKLFAKYKGLKNRIEALWVDTDSMWVVTSAKVFVVPRKNPSQETVILSQLNAARCILKTSSNEIWIGSWNGAYRIDSHRRITHYPATKNGSGLSDNQVRCVIEDNNGQIWIGTFRGLDCYVPRPSGEGKWKHYTRYGNTSNTLRHHSVLSLCKDNAGSIWVGTYYGGVHVFNPDEAGNRFYEADSHNEGNLSFPVVGRMTEDPDGNLWICTEGGGLNCLHADSGTFTSYKHKLGDPTTPGSNNLKSIYYCSKNNRLYVGSHWGGLFVLDMKSGKGHTLCHAAKDPHSLPHDIVNDIQAYKNGLALLTQGGPTFFDVETEKCSPLVADAKLQRTLRLGDQFETFLIDSKQRMWMAPSKGGLVCIDLATSKTIHFEKDSTAAFPVDKFVTVNIFEDAEGGIFFATIGAGLLRYVEQDHTFKSYNTSNGGFPCDYCYYIAEATQTSHLYVLHREGVSVFDYVKEKTDVSHHWYNQTYFQGSSLYKSRGGMLYISGTNGLVSSVWTDAADVSPDKLKFDRLYVLNTEVHPGGEDGILKQILSKTKEIRLNHRQNNVTVEFATFDYGEDRYSSFEYKLEGFDNVWTQTSSNKVTYTNIPPGKYVLCVRPLPYSKEGTDEIRLKVRILPPFYQTWWAYLIYICCATALGAAFIRLRTRQLMLRSSLEYERKEKERIEGMNQLKLRFFTNISHEFRTPLTLIIGQMEMMLQSSDTVGRFREHLQSVYRNAWHMRNLISELLDFRKQEQGFLKLRVEKKDLVPFVQQIYMCFADYARQREIDYNLEVEDESINLWFDPVQLQKVIFNLLSNAFKYTSAKGSITVKIEKQVSTVTVSVSDTGVGIPEEEIDKIFNRFYQARENSSVVGGTGIGLALAEGIMSLHHGSIDVKSKVGEGTRFVLSLRLGHDHFSEDEMAGDHAVKNTDVLPDIVPITPYEQQTDASSGKQNGGSLQEMDESDRPVVLIVEDNEELLGMLRDVFSSEYIVYTATNGADGLEVARQEQPNLIISDVMMPQMSGTELCRKIKEDVELSHISVILLTAKVSEESTVEGLMFGADDYMAKPFSMKVLMAKCESILQNKRRLLGHYGMEDVLKSHSGKSGYEDLKKLHEVCVPLIRENFLNADFGIDDIAKVMCMGRSTLYKRFKDLTGLTPNEFILKIKFDDAMEMLKKRPDLTIAEIALRLGFSTSRYFSRSFKAFFGVTPTSIRNELKGKADARSEDD